jgi:hypothetical protein
MLLWRPLVNGSSNLPTLEMVPFVHLRALCVTFWMNKLLLGKIGMLAIWPCWHGNSCASFMVKRGRDRHLFDSLIGEPTEGAELMT